MKPALRWALYDWANSAYATVVIAGFFPIFFREYWNAGEPSDSITLRLGIANSVASLFVALSAPLLGAVADISGQRRSFLIVYSLIGILGTGALFWVPQGEWLGAALLYGIAGIGFMGGNAFYDSMLVQVAERKDYERVSSWGYALGYLGGGLLFAFAAGASIKPALVGLNEASEVVRWSFLLVALWWLVFALPLFLSRLETQRESISASIRPAWRTLIRTIKGLHREPQILWFLAAYWLYIDGVDTIIRMAVDYGGALGFKSKDLILALLLTQFVGFPAALVFGRLGERYGPKRGIFIAIGVYCLITLWGANLTSAREFYGIAISIGLVQGGIQALSRSLYARLIPAERASEYFGFYNIMGKFAAVIGPLLVGMVGAMSGSPRIGIASILILFFLGAALLFKVDTTRQTIH